MVEPADGNGLSKKVNRRYIRRCAVSIPEEPKTPKPCEVSTRTSGTESNSEESSDDTNIVLLKSVPDKRRKGHIQRRSERTTKGRNPNPFNLPRSVLQVNSVEGSDCLCLDDLLETVEPVLVIAFYFSVIGLLWLLS